LQPAINSTSPRNSAIPFILPQQQLVRIHDSSSVFGLHDKRPQVLSALQATAKRRLMKSQILIRAKRLFSYAFPLLLVLSGIVLLARGQERFDLKVRNYFFAGFQGDNAALAKGMKLCEEALASDPKKAEALVWHGSGLYYQSGQAFRKGDQEKGGELWQRGIEEMDKAVSLAPDEVGVRIPRGAALLTGSQFVPDPAIARPLIERGLADFEKTWELQKNYFEKLGTHPRGELMLGLADGYSRLGETARARQWFERIRQDLPGTPYEDSANTWLKTGSLSAREAGCLGCHTAQ
jgi:tetratricopeptide (TPR) repeat protein